MKPPFESIDGALYQGADRIAECEGSSIDRNMRADRIAATLCACHGLDLPAEVPAGILADVVAAARDAATMGPGAEGTFPALEYCLAKLGPAAPSPGSTGDGAGPVSPPSYEDLAAALRDALSALKLVHSSGPLHNGLTDENTLAEVDACLRRYKVIPEAVEPVPPEEGTYQDLATYRTATGKIALNMARRWRQGEWSYSYNGLRAAGSGHPLKHAQATVRSMLRHHPKDHLAEGQDILEFTD